MDARELAEKDRTAREWCADPHRYFKAFSRTARRFQQSHPSPRYRVMTLVGGAQDFLPRRPLQRLQRRFVYSLREAKRADIG